MIIKEVKPIVLYRNNLPGPHTRHTVTKKGLLRLSDIEKLNYFALSY